MNFDEVIKENVPLYKYTTLKTGGIAKYFATASTIEELEKVRQFAKQTALPWFILGGGSNVLIPDDEYNGIVIHNKIKEIRYVEDGDSVTIACGAGEILDNIIEDTVSKGYWGLENLSAIPGTVGATPVQNVGAYGVEVSDLVVKVEAFDMKKGEICTFSNEECEFSYRDSFFKTEKGRSYVITMVYFKLSKKPILNIGYKDLENIFRGVSEPTQKEIREAVINIRLNKFPDWKKVGTAGSFFKNPIVDKSEAEVLKQQYPDLPVYEIEGGKVKISLGYVLDKICGLKGYEDGGIGLYEKQALVLINYRSQNAKDIKKFANKISKIVYGKTKLEINPEIFYL